ncbi:MAG: multicopper oxidase family protein, partial [Flavobacteriaceae bacterium]
MTRVNRRQLLLGGGALIAAPAILRRAAAAPAPAELVVGEADAVLLDGGGPARLWAFNGASPGPLLRVRKGGEVAVRLRNGLAEGTSIHWHGIRIDNAMDGVVHLTQPPVGEGETFDYRFTAPDAGTFWYHPHTHESWRQVSMGLYGVLVVEEDEPVDVDHDVVMVVDDWRVREDGGLDTESLGNFHDAAHVGRLGNILTVNGKPFEALEFPAGSRLRLRLVSTATARILRLALDGGEAWVVARDGQPVAVRELAGTMVLSPGQRIDLVLDVTGDPGAAITLSEVTGETPLAAARIVVAEGTGSRRAAPPEALPGNLVALPRDFDPRQSVDLVMEG